MRDWAATLSAPDPVRVRRSPARRPALATAFVPSSVDISSPTDVRLTLRRMRECSGMSRDEMAKRLDVSEKTIKRIEGGERSPRLDELTDWADICGYSLRLEVTR